MSTRRINKIVGGSGGGGNGGWKGAGRVIGWGTAVYIVNKAINSCTQEQANKKIDGFKTEEVIQKP